MSDADRVAGLRWAAEKCERERVHQLRLLAQTPPDGEGGYAEREVYEAMASTARDLRDIMLEEAERLETKGDDR